MSGSREFFFINKDFSGTDIYHSGIKNALFQIKKLFFLTKSFFFKIHKIF